MFVLLGSVATELRWGGHHNNTFTRHEFLVVTVKEWLKLVYFYQSYRKISQGSHLFWTTLYIVVGVSVSRANDLCKSPATVSVTYRRAVLTYTRLAYCWSCSCCELDIVKAVNTFYRAYQYAWYADRDFLLPICPPVQCRYRPIVSNECTYSHSLVGP